MILSILAVNQPTPDGGPFEPIANKFMNLGYFFTGVVAVIALILSVVIYYYQKWTMQKSEVMSWIFGGCVLLTIAAASATIVNHFMGS